MAVTNNMSQWVAPKYTFSISNQMEEWKAFYVRALNYLEILDIDVDTPGQTKKDGSR